MAFANDFKNLEIKLRKNLRLYTKNNSSISNTEVNEHQKCEASEKPLHTAKMPC